MKPRNPFGGAPVALTLSNCDLPLRSLGLGFLAAAATLLAATTADAACRINIPGAKCVEAPKVERPTLVSRLETTDRNPAPVAVGETLDWEYMMLLNSEYFGLPPAENGWVYFRAGDHVVRADYQSREVLEVVTHMTNRAFF